LIKIIILSISCVHGDLEMRHSYATPNTSVN